MNDDDIDEALKRAASDAREVDPALLERVSRSIGASLQPVRPLPSSGLLAAALAATCAGVAVAGGLLLGPHGILAMSAADIGGIFPLLGVLIWFTAVTSVGEMIPGRLRRLAPTWLLAAACAGLIAVFALLFREYRVERFVHQGIVCLTAGLAVAIPMACLGCLVLRRGFAVDSVAAGLAQGTLAGLAGVAMLELHCPNFEAPHVMVWHTAVLAVSGAAGALLVRATRSKET